MHLYRQQFSSKGSFIKATHRFNLFYFVKHFPESTVSSVKITDSSILWPLQTCKWSSYMNYDFWISFPYSRVGIVIVPLNDFFYLWIFRYFFVPDAWDLKPQLSQYLEPTIIQGKSMSRICIILLSVFLHAYCLTVTTASLCKGKLVRNPSTRVGTSRELTCSTLQTLVLQNRVTVYENWEVLQLTNALSLFIHRRCHTNGSVLNGIFEMPSLPSESSIALFCGYNYKKVLFTVRLCESCPSEHVDLLICNAPYRKTASPLARGSHKPQNTEYSFQHHRREVQHVRHGSTQNKLPKSVILSNKGEDHTERKARTQTITQPYSLREGTSGTQRSRPVAASITIWSKSSEREAIIKKAIGAYFSRNRKEIFRPNYHITYTNTRGNQYRVVFRLKKKILSNLSWKMLWFLEAFWILHGEKPTVNYRWG